MINKFPGGEGNQAKLPRVRGLSLNLKSFKHGILSICSMDDHYGIIGVYGPIHPRSNDHIKRRTWRTEFLDKTNRSKLGKLPSCNAISSIRLSGTKSILKLMFQRRSRCNNEKYIRNHLVSCLISPANHMFLPRQS